MSTENNKRLHARLFDEAMNAHDLSKFDELISPDYVNYDMPAPEPGREGFKKVMGMFLTAFPDMHVQIEEVIAEGDLVVSRGYWEGTHRGEFQGIPATGKRINVKYIDIWRFKNGRGIENWIQMDSVGLLQQLGVMPG